MGTQRPAVGATAVASSVATTGPTTKTSSSSADSSEYAVWMAPGSPSRCVQRARTNAPTAPMLEPVTTAAAYSHQASRSERNVGASVAGYVPSCLSSTARSRTTRPTYSPRSSQVYFRGTTSMVMIRVR